MTRVRGIMGLALGCASLAGLGAIIAAPADSASSAGTVVTFTLSEWKLDPGQATVRAGRVSFVVKNAGTMIHEFTVLRSDRHHHRLNVKGGRAVETGRVGRIAQIPSGASKRITLRLAPGKYVLLCNLLGHYQAGQFASLHAR